MAIMRPEGRLSRQGGANTGGQRGRWEQEAAGLEFLPREEFELVREFGLFLLAK